MELKKAFDKINKIEIHPQKRERIKNLLDKLAEANVAMDKINTIQTLLENSEKQLTLRKSMDAGMVSSDIEAFSNVLSVIIPKFFTNSIIDKIVSVQASETPYPVIHYVEWLYGSDYAGDSTVQNILGQPSNLTKNTPLYAKRTVGYGNVAELTEGRSIKASVTTKSLVTTIKRINAEWTLESIITLMSIMKQEDVYNFIDQNLTKTIYAKLKDEVEFEIINKMFTSTPANNVKQFELEPSSIADDPVKLKAYQERLSDEIENVSASIYKIYGVKPNQIIIGTDTFNILAPKLQLLPNNNFAGSLGRILLGSFNYVYEVFYDPYMDGHILLGCNYPDAQIYSAVYAPFLVGVTAPITEKNANTYRIVYRCDAFEVLLPNTLGRIDLV